MRLICLTLGPLAALLITGCSAMEEPAEPELTEAETAYSPCIGCPIPAVREWNSRFTPDDYVPSGVDNIQTLFTQGDSDQTFYAWGVSNGRAIYVHRAQKRDFEDYVEGLAHGWKTKSNPINKLSFGGGGSISSPPPRHPPQPGEPEFTQIYGDTVVGHTFDQDLATKDVLGQLGGLP